MVKIIQNLMKACAALNAAGADGLAWTEDGTRQVNHWGLTKREWEELLARRLTATEVTVLSLTRDYGPTPALDPETEVLLKTHLWPTGIPKGEAIAPNELSDKLHRLPVVLQARMKSGRCRVMEKALIEHALTQ